MGNPPNGDWENAEEVCEECLRETKIIYDAVDGHGESIYKREPPSMMPILPSINHLALDKSRIFSSKTTLIFEYLATAYQRITKDIHAEVRRLFPRRPGIWGKHFTSASIVGRTTYAGRKDHGQPIHHLYVELWARTRWLSWRRLAQGYSGHDGSFRLPYDLREARARDVGSIRLEVSQIRHRYVGEDHPESFTVVAAVLPISKHDLVGMEYNVRDIQVDLWAYRTDTELPRTKISDHDHDAPEAYVDGRNDAMEDQFIPIELRKLKHLAQLDASPGSLSIQDIQDDYPLNLTTCIERKLPGYTRSDEFFGERMMNGMNAVTFVQDRDEPTHYWVENWGYQGYDHNEIYAFPTTLMKFEILPGDHAPRPLSITLVGPTNAYDRSPYQQRTFTPEDGEWWTYAKRVARSVGGLISEVDDHFARTHLNTEQYALAANRNLRRNPVAWLLLPHLKEVSLVDHTADRILVSQEEGYIPRASALTGLGLQQRVKDTLGLLDWKAYRPMTPVNDHHSYAKAETLFWDVTYDYVSDFVERNLAGIREHWYEIYAMSEDLVNHSVPVFRCGFNLDELPAIEVEIARRRNSYFQTRFGFHELDYRPVIDGHERICSPVTTAKHFVDAGPDDLDNLIEMCCYAIHVATFQHSWVNEKQYEDIGEVLYSCLGLRFGEGRDGILAPESDLRIAPDPLRATQMMWWSNLLSRTEYGFIIRNEDGDVNPRYGKMLEAHREEFAGYGLDIRLVESRTNI